jgi:RHS repeat-associated protein
MTAPVRVISIKYLSGTPHEKVYSYEYDVAGNLLYAKDNATGNHLVDYSDFTALGQQKIATFPKPNNISVKTTYTYDPPTARLKTLVTKKLVGGTPTDTFQDLNYQQFDGKGNIITIADALNGITHGYTYDSLDRLLTANGVGTNPYSQSYQYDRIGNITYKSDVGSYSYTYSSKPHAVRTAGNISLQYDLNGNMTQRAVSGGITLDITYSYDNKPNLIKKNGSNFVQFTYDGYSQRVKKYNYTTGQTVLYFGELYEVRGGAATIHVFAGNQRLASVFLNGTTQFYHSNHLGSASFVTDQSGARKEQIEYFPFGTYRAVGNVNGTYDFDTNFPDVFYTFTGQEDDDDLGLYNFKARLYDPLLGRFLSPDSLVPYPHDPQSLNRYSYVSNNPLKYVDPEGHFFFGIIFGAIFGAIMGAVSSAINGGKIWKGNEKNLNVSEAEKSTARDATRKWQFEEFKRENAGTIWNNLRSNVYKPFGPIVEFLRGIDSMGGIRFGDLHPRFYKSSQSIWFHYDKFDLILNPVPHFFVDYLWNVIHGHH